MGERLAGVDAARGVALLGMVAVHVLPATDADGSRSLVDQLVTGRAAATFAVLAGVGVALATGRERPVVGSERRWARVSLLVRALLVGAIGLALGFLDSGLAVILAYYALLFAVAVPVLGVRPQRLAAAALVVAVVVPAVSLAVRAGLPPPPRDNPTFAGLADPAELLTTLLLTGYYPVLAWTAYLLAGLAVGRLPLARPRVAAALVATGAALLAGATALSSLLLRGLGGYDALARAEGVPREQVADEIAGNRFGNVPTDTAWWLAVDEPHASTTPDLVATTGTALVVLGLALLLAGRAPRLATPLAALGAVPLTLYTAHVITVSVVDTDRPGVFYLAQVVAALVIGLALRRAHRRGPLEALVARAARTARGRRSLRR